MPAQQPADPNGKPSIYVPYETSGVQGGYMFTDLAHLDSFIAQWQTLHDDIEEDGQVIMEAAQTIEPPADDPPSVTQARTAQDSLFEARNHNHEMRVHAKGYLDRLTATRTQYAADDEGNADRLRNVEPD